MEVLPGLLGSNIGYGRLMQLVAGAVDEALKLSGCQGRRMRFNDPVRT